MKGSTNDEARMTNQTTNDSRARPGFCRLDDYTFVDYATQGYLALVGLMVLFLYRGDPARKVFFLAAHGLCIILIQFLIRAHARHPGNRVLDFLRHFYPILLYAGFYREGGELNQMFVTGYLDGFFIQLDQRLFGCQPSIRFMQKLPYLAVSELFYMAYFSYYIMIGGVGLTLYLRDRLLFWRYVSLASFVFYICYLIYIIVPVVGARVFYVAMPGFDQQQFPFFPLPYPPGLDAGPFFNIMKFIYAHMETPGSAFPSSHVAIALCTLYFSWRFIPKIRWFHLVMVILLSAATVYCRYHYLVDVFAGALTAGGLIPVGEALYRKTAARQPAA